MGQSDHRPQVFQVFKVSSNVYNVRRQESTWGKAISKGLAMSTFISAGWDGILIFFKHSYDFMFVQGTLLSGFIPRPFIYKGLVNFNKNEQINAK